MAKIAEDLITAIRNNNSSMSTLPEERQLNQALRSRHISLISLGGIIGSAYFLGTGYLINQVGPGAFLTYILGGLITFITMSCLSELTLAVPERGSFIHFSAKFICHCC